MRNFSESFASLSSKRSPLCLGIDPAPEILKSWRLSVDITGLRRFCEIILEAAGDSLAVIKPQSAFFEQFGSEGIRELERLVVSIRDRGSLSLIDCKRGDIGHTLEAYADTYIGDRSPFNADAITVSPYLGLAALKPVFDQAEKFGSAVFVVVRSSNPEGAAIQDARLPDGRSVADALADGITEINAGYGDGIGPVGAVMGATLQGESLKTLDRLPKSLLLAPGIGAQGATFATLAKKFGPAASRTLPSASRSILSAGPSINGLRDAIQRHQDEAVEMLHVVR